MAPVGGLAGPLTLPEFGCEPRAREGCFYGMSHARRVSETSARSTAAVSGLYVHLLRGCRSKTTEQHTAMETVEYSPRVFNNRSWSCGREAAARSSRQESLFQSLIVTYRQRKSSNPEMGFRCNTRGSLPGTGQRTVHANKPSYCSARRATPFEHVSCVWSVQ